VLRRRHGRLVLLGLWASVLAFLPAALLSLLSAGAVVSTEDRNADGRPDVWRHFDRQGHIASVSFDTNFDGQSDVREFYTAGLLVRRDSDRNFNNQVDLIQEFDSETQDPLRAISDVDFDGQADEQVLFAYGQAAFVEYASTPQASDAAFQQENAVSSDDDHSASGLAALADPFAAELAVRALRAGEVQHVDAVPPDSSVASVEGPDSCVVDRPGVGISPILIAHLSARPHAQHSPRGPPRFARS